VMEICRFRGVKLRVLGAVGGEELTLEGLCSVRVEDLAAAHDQALSSIVD